MKKRISLALVLALVVTASSAAAAPSVLRPQARLRGPAGLLLGDHGTLYVADSKSNTVLELDRDHVDVTGHTLPDDVYGTPVGAYLDGKVQASLFCEPFALIRWKDGLVVSDTGNHCLRLIGGGVVRTLAGNGEEGMVNAFAPSARFSRPMGLAVDDKDNLYVADSGNGLIRKITPEGFVSTAVFGLDAPAGLCWDSGKLYITDMGLQQVLCAENGQLRVLAGISQSQGFTDGPARRAMFSCPMGIAVEQGTIYVADSGNSAVRRIRDGRVTTVIGQENQGTSIWPAEPIGLQAENGVLYVADRFAGILFTVEGRQRFADVPADSWYRADAELAADAGLMVGTAPGQFSPEGRLTRAMCARILSNYQRSLDRDAVLPGSGSFRDVAQGAWYGDAVSWASSQSIMTGWDGLFLPDREMNREEFVTALYRYAVRLGAAETVSGSQQQFSDWETVSAYAVPAMSWAVEQGIVNGTPAGTLEPSQRLTRAQAGAILGRWLTLADTL